MESNLNHIKCQRFFFSIMASGTAQLLPSPLRLRRSERANHRTMRTLQPTPPPRRVTAAKTFLLQFSSLRPDDARKQCTLSKIGGREKLSRLRKRRRRRAPPSHINRPRPRPSSFARLVRRATVILDYPPRPFRYGRRPMQCNWRELPDSPILGRWSNPFWNNKSGRK